MTSTAPRKRIAVRIATADFFRGELKNLGLIIDVVDQYYI